MRNKKHIKGETNGLAWIVGILLVLALLYGASQYKPGSTPYVPGVQFTMNPTSVSVANNTLSTIVTLGVMKTDAQNVSTSFRIVLVPSGPNLYSTSVQSGSTQYNYTTKILKFQNAQDSVQFKIHANLPPGAGSNVAQYNMTATLYYNNSVVGSPQVLTVDVHK